MPCVMEDGLYDPYEEYARMAAEYEGRVGFNCLWPCTAIATAAVDMLGGTLAMKSERSSGGSCATVPMRRFTATPCSAQLVRTPSAWTQAFGPA